MTNEQKISEIDEFLAMCEDHMHGEDGKQVSKCRRLLREISPTSKPSTDYLETHFEVVKRLTLELEVEGRPSLAFDVVENQGLGGLYELAESLTDEFQELHKDTEWDGDFHDTLEQFLNEKLLP